MRRTTQAHYVTHNKVTRVPRAHIYLDSEAYRTETRFGETQTFRLAVTAYDRKTHGGDNWRPREWADHVTTESVWSWVDAHTQARARTVLVAHNLAYDLRLCDAFTWFPAHGWTLKGVRLAERQAWATWTNGGRTLAMVDSLSWVALSLERVGELCEIAKLPLPPWDDSDDAWFARCRRDVEILADMWRRIVGWLSADDLGNFKPTGAGQAWAAYRHRFAGARLFVHDNDDARDAERESVYAGRCEAWRHGNVTGGPFYEWDFDNAYARIGVSTDLPIKLVGESAGRNIATAKARGRTYATLVQATVTTDVPTLPTRTKEGICWPVGTFTGTWWDNEIALAREHGARVEIERSWVYRTAPALKDFCEWVLDAIAPTNTATDPILRVVLKHWGRALIGRTAAQWSKMETCGRSDTPNVSFGPCVNVSTGQRFDLMQLGTQLIRFTDRKENPDAMVSVMAYVMAQARVNLWHAMNVAKLDRVVYVDTDSLWVDARGDANLRAANIPSLRVKKETNALEIFGPRALRHGDVLVAAGIPKGARKTGEREFEGEVWQGLPTALRTSSADRVQVTRRLFHIRGTDHRREHLPYGKTAAIVVDGAERFPPLTAQAV